MPEVGICTLSSMAIRLEASHKSEMVSQLLYGETYEVMDTSIEEWLKIKCRFDNYYGFIPKIQFAEFTETNDPSIFIGDLGNDAMNNIIPKGAEIYTIENLVGVETSDLRPFKSINFTLDQIKENIFFHSSSLINTPYLWGGRTPWGIDCSGFTQLVFKICGIALPRDSSQQVQVGRSVTYAEAALGDLAFFVNEHGAINHVGIIFGEQMIIHCSGFVRLDQLTMQGIINLDTKLRTHNLYSIRRILPEAL